MVTQPPTPPALPAPRPWQPPNPPPCDLPNLTTTIPDSPALTTHDSTNRPAAAHPHCSGTVSNDSSPEKLDWGSIEDEDGAYALHSLMRIEKARDLDSTMARVAAISPVSHFQSHLQGDSSYFASAQATLNLLGSRIRGLDSAGCRLEVLAGPENLNEHELTRDLKDGGLKTAVSQAPSLQPEARRIEASAKLKSVLVVPERSVVQAGSLRHDLTRDWQAVKPRRGPHGAGQAALGAALMPKPRR
jgi:hypothetical protein